MNRIVSQPLQVAKLGGISYPSFRPVAVGATAETSCDGQDEQTGLTCPHAAMYTWGSLTDCSTLA